MKLSLNWIKEYVDLPADLTMEKLAYDLTMRTVEVEGVENPKDSLEGIVVGRILEVAPHPDANMLRVCRVEAGQDHILQIVCGGSNLEPGQKVAVSVPGALVRWHGGGDPVEIGVTKLRGVMSEGMICGANELGLETLFPVEDEHIIMDLKDFAAEPGAKLAEVLELDDFVLEIDNKSMTNRPDLWGHYGMARELAAIYGTSLRPLPELRLPVAPAPYPVEIQTDMCMRYVAAVFENLTVEPAPYWMQKRLWAVDLRPINNLVDITNYVMLSTGQPTHGFDLSHVPDGIVVRQAGEGEKLELLDDTMLDLVPADMLITDGPQALALAGVMGGKRDSILPETRSMILELASFNALSVRRTTQRHGLRTEASTRFEKNIDTQRVDQALALAMQLMTEICPEAVLTSYGEAQTAETQPAHVRLAFDFLSSRIGRVVSGAEIRSLLEPLGFVILQETSESVLVQVPSWRSTGDVSLPDDLLEEVARMIGYENFEFIPPQVVLDGFVNQHDVEVERRLRETLAFRAGFQEIFTYPWAKDEFIAAAGLDTADWLELDAPPAPHERLVRGSLLPAMLESVAGNLRYFDHFRIFELAQVFRKGAMSPSEPEEVLPLQERSLCAALVGKDAMELFREAKGVIEALPRFAQTRTLRFGQMEKPAWADPKMWLNILGHDGTYIGSLGLLSLQAEHLAGIKHQLTVLFELNVEKLEALDSRENKYVALPLYPEVWQDLNVVVNQDSSWSALATTIAPLVKRSRFIEEYYGKQLPEGTKSVIFRYWLGSGSKTLTAQDIEGVNKEILAVLERDCGAKLRS